MDSKYWKTKMDEYSEKMEEVKNERKDYLELYSQLAKISSLIDGCVANLKSSNKGLEKIIINGKTYDDGEIKLKAENLSSGKSDIQTLRRESSEKASELWDELRLLAKLYDKAKKNYEAALASENNQSQVTNTPSNSQSNSSKKAGSGKLQIKQMIK